MRIALERPIGIPERYRRRTDSYQVSPGGSGTGPTIASIGLDDLADLGVTSQFLLGEDEIVTDLDLEDTAR